MKKRKMFYRILAGVMAFAVTLQSPMTLMAESAQKEENTVVMAEQELLEEGNISEATGESVSSKIEEQPPTEPPTEPVQPPTEPPTEPVQPPTEPPTEPVQPSTEPPTEPVQPPTEPPTEPEQPLTELPTEPVQPPTEPSTEPVQPPSETEETTEQSAEMIPGESEQTEKTTESSEELETEKTSEQLKHVPEDITGNMDQLKLNLSEPWYIGIDGNHISLSENTGLMDFSGISPELLLDETKTVTAGMTVLFRLTQDAEARTVGAGDWFYVQLPAWMENLRFTDNGQNCMDDSDAKINGAHWELNAQEKRIRVTFTENIEEVSGIHGRLGFVFDINRSALGTTQTEQNLVLQNGNSGENICVLNLPAMPAADEIQEEGMITAAAEKEAVAEYNAAAKATVIWQDRIEPAEAHALLHGRLTAAVTKNGEELPKEIIAFGTDGKLKASPEQMKLFGWEEASVPVVTTGGANKLNQTITADKLPSRRIDGEEEFLFYWSLELDTDAAKLPAGYLMAVEGEGRYIMTPTTTFTAKVDLRSGDTVDEDEKSAIVNNLQIFVDKGSFSDAMNRFVQGTPAPEITLEIGDAIGSLTITGIPWCDAGKLEYVYSAAIQDKNTENSKQSIALEDGSGDTLIQDIDNSGSSNYGDVITEVHNNGTLILTRDGDTSYTATKYWLDDDKELERPAAEWALWRYVKGFSYQDGAPVRNANGEVVSVEVDHTALAGKAIEVNFDAALGDMQLPKYDSNGMEYVYYARETMTGENADLFEMVFGAPGQDGIDTSADKAPNWNSHGQEQVDGAWDRGSDPCIYNGGKLCNRLNDTVEVTQTKIWEAANYQDDLSDVNVTFQLQERPVRENSTEGDWKESRNEQGEAVTEMMGDFSAEKLTGIVSRTMPKYDTLGRELEYRWIESAVEKDGVNIPLELMDEGKTKFVFPHNLEAQAIDGEEYYISEIIGEGNPDYEKGTIVNRLVGTTRYDVRKVWAAGTTPTDSIKIRLQQRSSDGVIKNLEYTMTGEGTVWDYAIENLPKYDKTGRKYEYTVEEISSSDNYQAEYDYNSRDTQVDLDEHKTPIADGENDVNNVIITNRPVGLGNIIRVRKVWLDDGDVAHRAPVTVEVWRKGVADNELGTEDKRLASVTLTADQQWWSSVGVTEFEVTQDDRKLIGTQEELREAGVTADQFTADTLYQGDYYIKEVTMGERVVDYSGEQSQRGFAFIPGGDAHHGYEVFYAHPNENNTAGEDTDEDGFYTVYNRRVGIVDLEITKEWIDGNQPEEYRKGFGAEILLRNQEGAVTFTADGEGSVVNLGKDTWGNSAYQQPIYKDHSHRERAFHSQALTGEEDGQNASVHFYNLPKYDYAGRVLHYFVEETNQDKLAEADYKDIQINETSYEEIADPIYGSDGHDEKQVKITNRRFDTKTVKFHKKWIDQAVFEDGKRPDIYITLYSQDSVTGGVPEPYRYIDRVWTAHTAEGDTNYEWTCRFDNLPEYDENGSEITYYATEESHTPMTQLDYVPVQLGEKTWKTEDRLSDLGWDEDSEQYTVTHHIGSSEIATYAGTEEKPWLLTASDEKVVLKEDGWFINELRARVLVDGKKVWENIPQGFPVEELPRLNFILKYKEDAEDNSAKALARIDDIISEDLTFDFKFHYLGQNDKDGEPIEGQGWEEFIPKYNPATGALYHYTVTEEIHSSEATEDIETAYEALPGEVHNYVIVNTYNADATDNKNWGNISIKKDWSNVHGLSAEKITAEATFELYRFYEDKTGKKYLGTTDGEGERIAILKLSADGQEMSEGTFEKIFTTAPNGKPYLYYVKEKTIDGFECGISPDITGGQEVDGSGKEGWPTNLDNATKVFRFEKITAAHAAKQDLPSLYKDIMVTAENTYNLAAGDSIALTGNKVWEDNSDIAGIRPGSLELVLYRWTEKQPGADVENAIAKEAVGRFTLLKPQNSSEFSVDFTLESGCENVSGKVTMTEHAAVNTSNWQYKIENLDRYAPNGAPWKYEVREEKLPKGYTCKEPTGKMESIDESGMISLKPIVNRNLTNLTVQKDWNQNDSLQRQDTVYALQINDGDGWRWASEWLMQSGDIEFEKMLQSSQSRVVFSNLPEYGKDNNQDIVKLIWRAAEVQIGDQSVHFGEGTGNAYTSDGAMNGLLSTEYALIQPQELLYMPMQKETAVEEGSQSCTVINTPLNGHVTLEIIKNWEDGQNKFLSRPQKDGKWVTHFLIQRRAEGESAYVPVLDTIGNPYVVEMTGENTEASKTMRISGLPKTDGVGRTYQYAAREAVKTGAGWEIADNERNRFTGYEVKENDADSETIESGYRSAITNQLETTGYSLTKRWSDVQQIRTDKEVKLTLWVKEGTDVDWRKASELWPESGVLIGYPDETAADVWAYETKELPKTSPSGKKYQYGVFEETVPGYADPVYGNAVETDSGIQILLLDKQSENTIENHATAVYLDKIDMDGKRLPNSSRVVLELTGRDSTAGYAARWELTIDKEEVVSCTATVRHGETVIYTANGTGVDVPIKGLPQGIYQVTETTAPDGYLPLPEDYTITLSDNQAGKTKVETAGGALIGTAKTAAENDTAVVRNRQTVFELMKTDEADANRKLAGAEFTLTGRFPGHYGATESYILVTGADGKATVKVSEGKEMPLAGLLIVGETYTLKESKAPEDYILLDDELIFKVEESGSLTIETAADGYTIETAANGNSNQIVAADKKISLTLKKVNESGEVLKGAKFDLYRGDKVLEENRIAKGLTTDENGLMEITDYLSDKKRMAVDQTYMLVETKAPKGYAVPENESERSLIFRIQPDGTVKFLQSNPLLFSGDGTAKITMTNLHEIRLAKRDNETGEMLTDEKLELMVKDYQDKEILRWGHRTDGYWMTVGEQLDREYRYLSIDQVSGVIRGLPAGQYKLTETGTPKGYVTVEEIHFILNADGTITEDNADAETDTKDEISTLTVTDKRIRGHVALTKTMEGEALQGVHFDLYRVNGVVDGTAETESDDTEDTKIAGDLVTDANGQWTSVNNDKTFIDESDAPQENTPFKAGLRSGTYYFLETQETADSIRKTTPVVFEIAAVQAADIMLPVTQTEVINEKFASSLKLTKADEETKEPISGDVVFRLTKINSEADQKEYAPGNDTAYDNGMIKTTGKDGTITFTGLTKGTYHLEEISARGYDLTTPFEADIVIGAADHNQIVEVKPEAEDVVVKHISNVKGMFTEYGIENPRAAANMKFTKVSAEEPQEALTGAEFTLQKKSADTYEDYMTGLRTGYEYAFTKGEVVERKETDDGVLSVNGLVWGEYRLVETAPPDGYVTADKTETEQTVPVMKEFSVSRDSFNQNNQANIELDPIRNYKTSLILRKRGTDGVEALADTVFTITGERFAGEEKGETQIECITDEDGMISLDGVLVTGVEYTLTETRAHAGYRLPKEALKFKLHSDGEAELLTAEVDEYELTEAGSFNNVITITNEPTSVRFIKRFVGDEKETGVPGAKLTLRPENGKLLADGSESFSWTSTETPQQLTKLLVSGDVYTVTETREPNGAIPVTEENKETFVYTFRLDETGRIVDVPVLLDGNLPGLTMDAEKNLLTLWNAPTSLLIHKTGTDLSEDNTELLTGAVYTITGKFAEGRYRGQEKTKAGEHTLTVTTNGIDTDCLPLLGRLIVGETYTIKEVQAPEGYALGTEIRFTVTGARVQEDGISVTEIEISEEDTDQGYEIIFDESGNPVILQKDFPAVLTLNKTDQESNPLAGAEFELTGTFAGESRDSTRRLTVDKDGKADLTKQLIESREGAEYCYRLREVKAPNGHLLLEGDIVFKMETTQEEGGRKSKAIILFGEDATPETLKNMVSVENDGETSVLNIQNEKEPEKPNPPAEPLEPLETEKPSETEESLETEPNPPSKPGKPSGMDSKPGSAGNSGNVTGQTTATSGARTGDETDAWMYVLLLAASAVVLAVSGKRRRVKK